MLEKHEGTVPENQKLRHEVVRHKTVRNSQIEMRKRRKLFSTNAPFRELQRVSQYDVRPSDIVAVWRSDRPWYASKVL